MIKPRILDCGIIDTKFGENVTVVQPSNIYGCTVGSGSFIGPFVEVQKGVVIGENCKIQSHSFICELVTIANNCFIGHGVTFVNDLFSDGMPAMGDVSKWGSTVLGNNVLVGSGSTILPVNICDGAVVGAGSVVTRDIEVPGIYAGNPCRLIREI